MVLFRSKEISALIAWGITKTLRGTIWLKRALVYLTLESVIPATYELKFLFASQLPSLLHFTVK